MFGFGKKHPAHGKPSPSKDRGKQGKRAKHGLFHGDIDDLTSPDELAIPTSLDEDVETLQSDDAVGETGTPQDDYGQGATGQGVDNALGPDNGGLDPFALASFGDDEEMTMDPTWQLDDYTDDLAQAFQPVGPDDFNFPEQVATLRHPLIDFGIELLGLKK